MIAIPDGFGRELLADEGDAARLWLAELPELLMAALRRWQLTVDGEPMHGYVAVVLPVRTPDGTAAVLKVGWPHVEAEHEALVLRLWDGDGAARLLAHDDADNAMLLERLDATRSLRSVDVFDAAGIAGRLARRLAVPAPPELRRLADVAAAWTARLPELAERDGVRDGRPVVPPSVLDAAVAVCRERGPRAADVVVNEDLHYLNVLHSPDDEPEREPWLVIDPKPLAGDLEFGVIPLLWNGYARAGGAAGLDRRVRLIADAADMDVDLVRAWTLARGVENWLWAARVGDDGGIPAERVCREISLWAMG